MEVHDVKFSFQPYFSLSYSSVILWDTSVKTCIKIYSKHRETNFEVTLHDLDKVIQVWQANPAKLTLHCAIKQIEKSFFYQRGIIGLVNPLRLNVPKWSDTLKILQQKLQDF